MWCWSGNTPKIHSFLEKIPTNSPGVRHSGSSSTSATLTVPGSTPPVLDVPVSCTKNAVVVINLCAAALTKQCTTSSKRAAVVVCLAPRAAAREGFIGSASTGSKYQHFHQPPSSSPQSSGSISVPPTAFFHHQLHLISLQNYSLAVNLEFRTEESPWQQHSYFHFVFFTSDVSPGLVLLLLLFFLNTALEGYSWKGLSISWESQSLSVSICHAVYTVI